MACRIDTGRRRQPVLEQQVDAVDDTGVGVRADDCRNGGFCAFDDEVPPGVKFQKIP